MPFTKSKVAVTETTAQSLPAYFRAINIIAEQIASLPVSVFESSADGQILEANTHPVYRLIHFRPSPKYNAFEFFETLVRQVMLRGQACVYVMRDARGAVSSFEILPEPIDFFQSGNGQYFYRFEGLTARWDEILHIKAYSLDGVCAQSPLKIFKEVFGLGVAQVEYAANYFGQGTHTSGLLTPESPMKPEQVEQVIKFWQRNNSGPDSTGKTGILPFGMKYQQLSSNPKDSQYVEGRHLTTEDVANITGVPIDLLNSGDKTSTYASAEQRMRQFVLFTLRTWCKRFEDEFNSKIFSQRDQGRLFIRFNLDGLLRGDTATRAGYYNTMLQNGVMTTNEVRALENMNPVPGGDEIRVPLNMAPQSNDNGQ